MSEKRVRSQTMFVRVRPEAKEAFETTAQQQGMKPSEAMRVALGEWVARNRKLS